MVYMYFPSQYEREVNLWLNKDFVDYYYEGGKMCIQPLGHFTPGEEQSFIMTITEDKNEVLYRDTYFYYLDEEMFQDAIDVLKQNPLELESFREDHLKGTITADEDGIMFTSIAWEPGWTVYVDGEKVEPVKLVDALIGVPLTAGTHTIEMKFFPAGMKLGIIVSLVGLITVIVIGIYQHKNRTVMLDRLYDI